MPAKKRQCGLAYSINLKYFCLECTFRWHHRCIATNNEALVLQGILTANPLGLIFLPTKEMRKTREMSKLVAA